MLSDYFIRLIASTDKEAVRPAEVTPSIDGERRFCFRGIFHMRVELHHQTEAQEKNKSILLHYNNERNIGSPMNEKNNRKRASITLDRKWHRRLKILSARFGVKLEDMIDEAAAAYLAKKPIFDQ